MPHSIEEKGLIEFETNFLKLLDVKEVFKVYRGLIVSMDGSHLYDWNNLYGWNNLNNR